MNSRLLIEQICKCCSNCKSNKYAGQIETSSFFTSSCRGVVEANAPQGEQKQLDQVVIRLPCKTSANCCFGDDHDHEFGDVFNEMRRSNQLCDVEIECDDLSRMPVHKALLSG